MGSRLRRRHRVVVSAAATAVLAAGVTVGLTSLPANAAAGEIRVPAGGQPLAGQYIVVLKQAPAAARTVQAVTATARGLVAQHGGTVSRTYSSALNGFAFRASDAQARSLAADARVAYVERDAMVRLFDTQDNATWGLDRIDQRNRPLDSRYTYNTTAGGISAYIIDTGIRVSHSEFGGRARVGTDTVGDGQNGNDCNGHGTHVAGTVGGSTYGVAKAVQLYAVRVLNCQGSGTNSGVIGGIDWVTQNARKPAVANMSLGGGASAALDQSVQNSIASGVTYAVAAGNDGGNACLSSPARVGAAITVGATDRNDAKTSWSSFGSCLDVFAPGNDITSAWNTSNTATNTISGTSMATPHVAGVAALYLAANPQASPAQVGNALVSNASSGLVSSPGSGSPNKLLHSLFGGTEPPPPPPGKHFESTGPVDIPDFPADAVSSPITVSGVTGNAPATLKVGVNITHTWRGDLVVDLVAPDGSVYNLHNRRGGSADNVIGTFTVDASSERANGTWNLRVKDMEGADIGTIQTWSLDF